MNTPQPVMRIKTITCHDVYNFGASLQAYALMQYLLDLGHQVEIINYKPDYMQYRLLSIGKKWKKRHAILRFLYFSYVFPFRLLLINRRNRFNKFTKEYLRLTTLCYKSYQDLKKDPPLADVYFAGSDQIWNSAHRHGQDPAFYLSFAPQNAIKASYAASFSIPEIAGEFKEFVRSSLIDYKAISVRERSGLRILESLGINRGVVVLDPVFLIDSSKWSKISSIKYDDHFLLVYDQENNPLIKKIAKRIAGELGLKIYAIQSLYPMYYADKKLLNVGPLEFLGLIKNCEVCLTNSFHGTSFSLIFHKEFYTFRRINENVNSRMIDLLGMLELDHRVIDESHALDLNQKIDYTDVNTKLEEHLIISRQFIESVLNTGV